MKYAGIGSRETPEDICFKMYGIAQRLALKGWWLRSGGAKSADTAFEQGCNSVRPDQKEIFVAKDAENKFYWHEHASKFHPNWNACSPYTMLLHSRNSAIMLGPELNDPVKFVLCWTKDGKASGGTGQALRIAEAMNIPVYNFFNINRLNDIERDCGLYRP